MAIQPMSFTPLSFEQNNPYLAGRKYNADIALQQALAAQERLKAQYAPQTMAEALKQSQLKTQMDEAAAQYAMPMAEAGLLEKQAMPQFYNAQAGHLNAEANKINKLLPTDIASARQQVDFPGLGQQGDAGTTALMLWLKAHPEKNVSFPGAQQAMETGNDLTLPINDKTNIALQNAGLTTQYNPQVALQQQFQQGFTPVNQNNVAQMLGQQRPQVNQALQQVMTPQQQQQVQGALQQAIGQQSAGQMQQPPANVLDFLQQSIALKAANKQAQTEMYNARARNADWNSMPVDQKDSLLAQTAGAGIDASKAVKMFNNGMTLEEIMATKGFTPGNYPAQVFPTTTATRTATQSRQQAEKEVDMLGDFAIDAIAPYSRTIFGFSPQQFSDSLSSNDGIQNLNALANMDNEKVGEAIKDSPSAKQSDFLASMILLPEISGARYRLLNGKQLGVQALDHLTEASALKVNYMRSLVTPEVWVAAQNKANKLMKKAASSANVTNYYQGSEAQQKGSQEKQNDPLGIR